MREFPKFGGRTEPRYGRGGEVRALSVGRDEHEERAGTQRVGDFSEDGRAESFEIRTSWGNFRS